MMIIGDWILPASQPAIDQQPASQLMTTSPLKAYLRIPQSHCFGLSRLWCTFVCVWHFTVHVTLACNQLDGRKICQNPTYKIDQRTHSLVLRCSTLSKPIDYRVRSIRSIRTEIACFTTAIGRRQLFWAFRKCEIWTSFDFISFWLQLPYLNRSRLVWNARRLADFHFDAN